VLKKKLVEKLDVKNFKGLKFSTNMMVEYIKSFTEDANYKE
jgi:hypothetical protein